MKTKQRPEPNLMISRFLLFVLGIGLSISFGSAVFAQATDTPVIQTLKVGGYPSGLAFDGGDLWVVNLNDDNVMKLRPSDGKLLGTFSVGTFPNAATFDGANIWITNGG